MNKGNSNRYYANHEKSKEESRLRGRRQRRSKPEINRRATARWRAKNKERMRALQARYRAKRGREYLKIWRQNNRAHYNCYMNNWRALNGRIKNKEDAIARLRSYIPKYIAPELKDDFYGELVIAYLDGRLSATNISASVKRIVGTFNSSIGRWETLKTTSLDAPFGDEGGATLGDVIAAQNYED